MDREQRVRAGVYGTVAVLIAVAVWLWAGGGEEPSAAVATPGPSVAAGEPDVTPAPSVSTPPAPLSTATPTPSADPVEAELAELRESTMWLGLAEWDDAWPGGKERFRWSSSRVDCPYGQFSNVEEVWNDFAPGLRDELLLMVIEDGVLPSAYRFVGKPIQDDFTSGVLGWWTNGPDGTQGRGSMFVAMGAYITRDGEHRFRQWPVLIGHGIDPAESTEAHLRAVGPVLDLSNDEIPDTYLEVNEQFNDHHLDWLFAQEPINPPIDPPLPCD